MADLTPDPILQVASGFMAAKHLFIANEVGLFTALALAASYDFGAHRRLLDLGGGTGLFLLSALRQHPQLAGTLFELPGAAAIARSRVQSSPLAARAQVVEGDFFQDPIPDGHDAV